LILTPQGEVPVEQLAIGGLVTTLSGEAKPIKWIGRRAYLGRFALGRPDILPITIKHGALGDNLPKRDLIVSPHHALYFEGVLIEACDLVNGLSITQADTVELVEYIHIELDMHDIIFAEGAPAESFVDDDTRMLFHNASEFDQLYPDAPLAPARYCAPRLKDGYAVESVRRQIEDRARASQDTDQQLPLRGAVDVAEDGRIVGWAQNPEFPDAPVCVDIYVAGRLIGQTLANRQRSDLAWAGFGSGRHGFLLRLPEDVIASPFNTVVRRSIDGRILPFSAECLERLREAG
jgi:hypothetical protein